MASPTRKALIAWLQTIEVRGDVIDVGGIAWPVEGKTKVWEVPSYAILDRRPSRKNRLTDIMWDLNFPLNIDLKSMKWDVAFCTEVTQFIYRPFIMLQNISLFLKERGLLYITFHLTHPPMKDADYLRYTFKGIKKLLDVTGFVLIDIQEPVEGYYLVKAICQP